MADHAIDILLRARDRASKQIDNVNRSLSKTNSIANRASKGISTAADNLKTMGAIGIGLAGAGLVYSINKASELEESMSKVTVVFGDQADEITAWAAQSASAFGQSKQQALEAVGTYGNLLQAFGVTRKAAAGMSTDMVELAADLASFNNTGVEEALEAIRSGLSGESEPLKRYGVALSVDRMKTVLLAEATKKLSKTLKPVEREKAIKALKKEMAVLTPLQKAQAAYLIIMQDSKLAQGDFARTSEGLANQQRILRANLDNTAATIGRAMLPVVGKLVGKINALVTENEDEIAAFAEKLPGAFDKLIAVAEKVPWGAIGSGLQMAAEWAGRFFDAFTSMPAEVQTTIIALAGLNKLSGGAISGIVGELGKGLIKGVLGMTAGVVHIKAGLVTGGGGANGQPTPIPGSKPGTSGKPAPKSGPGSTRGGGGTGGAGLLPMDINELKENGQAAVDRIHELTGTTRDGTIANERAVHTLDRTTSIGSFGIMSATNVSASRIVSAVMAAASAVPNVYVTVGPGSITKSVTTQDRAGKPNGSAGGGHGSPANSLT